MALHVEEQKVASCPFQNELVADIHCQMEDFLVSQSTCFLSPWQTDTPSVSG